MMDQRQRELRRAAARDFIKSLDQLRDTLYGTASYPPEPANTSQPEVHSPTSFTFDLKTFEQAVADIEEFTGRQKEGE